MAKYQYVDGGRTILKQIAEDEELRDKIAREDAQTAHLADRAKFVGLDGWLAAYRSGQVSLEGMCRGVVAVGRALPDDDTWRQARYELIGYAVTKAIENPPERNGRGNAKPEAFKRWAAELVTVVHKREGLMLGQGNKAGDKTAYARVAELFAEAGVRGLSERTIRGWYDDYRDQSHK